MRSAKGLFRIRTACLPRGTKGATRCRLRFLPLAESPRAQPRLSFGSLPLAQLHQRNTVCARKRAFNPIHASCTSARYRLR